MQPKLFITICVIICLNLTTADAATTAAATTDPRFSFAAAEAAFAKAAPPTSNDLAQRWQAIGHVGSPSIGTDSNSIDFYDLSGKYQSPSRPGYFKRTLRFDNLTDAFGNQGQLALWAITGVETGKLYREDSDACSVVDTGLRCLVDKTDAFCASDYEIRRVDSTGMLIIAFKNTDRRAACSEGYGLDVVSRYAGMLPEASIQEKKQ